MPSPSPVLNRLVTLTAGVITITPEPVFGVAITKSDYVGGTLFSQSLDSNWAFRPSTNFPASNGAASGLLQATRFYLGDSDNPAGDLGNTLRVVGPTDGQYVEFEITGFRRQTAINVIEIDVTGGTQAGDDWNLSGETIMFRFAEAAAPVVSPAQARRLWARITELEGVSLGLVGLAANQTEQIRERCDVTIRYQSDLDRITAVTDDIGREWDAISTRHVLNRRFSVISCEREVEQPDA